MYQIDYTNRFKRDVRICQKRGLDLSELQAAVRLLAETGTLPRQYHPHRLLGRRTGQWECHIKPDWLMVWE